jgi:putative transposase
MKVRGCDAVYHCVTRTVNGELLFGDREKEVLRKMLWQVADFCGVEILTYCVMSNHFHVLLCVRDGVLVSDAELMRRYRVLYPKPTKYQEQSAAVMELQLLEGGEEAAAIRGKLLARMADVSEFMKAVKQRFSIWFNRTHQRYGTLWAERFKSVLVEGQGNPLQTMAAYIDLNPVRAGLVQDPKDYRFCGYGEAVAGFVLARRGLLAIWSDYVGSGGYAEALRSHRRLIYVKGSNDQSIAQQEVLRVLDREDALLPKSVVLRCRVRYFTDGVILGSREFVQGYVDSWQAERKGSRVDPTPMRGADWGDLTVMQGLRKGLFG